MVKFTDLRNNPNNRKVRNVIMSGTETIRVFEPSKEDTQKIIDMQERFIDEGDTVEISGATVVRELVPLLTDIEGFDELTDEELEKILDEPSLALTQVQQEIEIIITEVYKTILLHSRKQLQSADFNIEAFRINAESADRILALNSRENPDGKSTDEMQKKIADLLAEMETTPEEREASLDKEIDKVKKQLPSNQNKAANPKTTPPKATPMVATPKADSAPDSNRTEYANAKYGGMLEQFETSLKDKKKNGVRT